MSNEKESASKMDPERAAIYQAYEKTQVPEAPPAEEPKPEPEQPTIEAEAPKEPEVEVTAETPNEDKPQEEKLVPKQALDEERAKRKRLREEKEALEAELKAYRERVVPTTDPEPIPDYDAAIHDLRREVETFKMMEARREEMAKEEAARQQREQLNNKINKANIDLAEEGYPGFQYMTSAVLDELQKIANDDPDLAATLDNPDGWKKIYKESVYPSFKKHQDEATRKRSLETKTSLKKDATLAQSTGKAPVKKEDDDPNTWSHERKMQEYLKMREKGITPGMRSPL